MRDLLFIFGAKYLFLFSFLVAGLFFALTDSQKKKKMVRYSVWFLPILFICSRILALLYYNPRPFISEQIVPLISHSANNGFPSDHTLIAAALAGIVTFFNRKIAFLLWAMAIVVGASRVYVGVHHWIDVFASLVLTIVVAYIVFSALRLRDKSAPQH